MSIIQKGRKYGVSKVLDKILLHCKRRNMVDFGGDMINLSSKRYLLFKIYGTICKECGLRGEYFIKEKHGSVESEPYHLSLYGIDRNGQHVRLTRDHIVPSSRGGHDTMENSQILCERCNAEKGNNLPENKQSNRR